MTMNYGRDSVMKSEVDCGEGQNLRDHCGTTFAAKRKFKIPTEQHKTTKAA